MTSIDQLKAELLHYKIGVIENYHQTLFTTIGSYIMTVFPWLSVDLSLIEDVDAIEAIIFTEEFDEQFINNNDNLKKFVQFL